MHISEEELLQKYIPFDKAVPYKDFMISPIKMRDIYDVQYILAILQIDKNDLGNIEFISMSFLRFILILAFQDEQIQFGLNDLLCKALLLPEDYIIQIYADDDQEYLVVGKKIKELYGHDIVDDKTALKITADDFNEIIRIILYQNVVDYSDKYVDPDVRRAADEYYKLKNKNATKVSLEHKTNCVQLKTGLTKEAIGDLTIRNFLQLYDIMIGIFISASPGSRRRFYRRWPPAPHHLKEGRRSTPYPRSGCARESRWQRGSCLCRERG